MSKPVIPLKETSIEELFLGNEKNTYEIPIYQRNYAWEKDEISALVQDVYDAYRKDSNRPYYIGTLVSFNKGDKVYEIIDGQQRLTTLRLVLTALGISVSNRLTYRARRKSDNTLRSISDSEYNADEKDSGIENGYKYVKSSIGEIVPENDLAGFISYFKSKVHIIHYQVPKDIDLNHYFEIMNSRGEQLEKHEIVKANLMEKLIDPDESKVFNCIWECCSEMSIYAQQNISGVIPEDIFGKSLEEFIPSSFDDLCTRYKEHKKDASNDRTMVTLESIISSEEQGGWVTIKDDGERKDSFLPIIDFPNFLLIVLKLTRMDDPGFLPADFNLDDKELLNEFNKIKMDVEKVKKYAFNLLKARFFLDNYVVHHSKEEDTLESNPWKLQVWHKDVDTRKGMLRNLTENTPQDRLQDRLTHLLSMFEVSFTARQRKNYLFYCLLYLMQSDVKNIRAYAEFVEGLADRYFNNVYLDAGKLNTINTPLPGSFDEVILDRNCLRNTAVITRDKSEFINIYGDGIIASKGVPLFVFNYLDYRLWKLYDTEMRGNEYKEGSSERKAFFDSLGCGDFGLNVFDQFYFSRTRRSLEHYYPQANVDKGDGSLNDDQINCLGNYAMIGSEANSSGSNWSPKAKLDHYLDSSGKISQISVASLKFMIMMQVCKDKQYWLFDEIKDHQERMISVMLAKR